MIAHISDQSDNEVAGLCSNPQLPVILARIEIYIILNFQKQTTIGMVLRRCFERQQLFSPFMSSDRTAYSDVYVLFMALQAVTMKINVTWQKYKRIFDNFCSGQKKLGSPSQFVPISSLNIRILALHMRSKEERGFRTDLEDHNNIGLTRNGPESHTGATFRGDDLQIHNLVKLGRFHIKWMEDATHHLKIRNGFYGQTVLMIYWFGIGNTDKWNQREVPYYTTRVWPENLDRWELEFTMSILFGYDESQRRLMRQAYASVEAPIWLWPFHEELLARPAVKDDPFSTRSFNKVRIPMLGVYLKQYPPYGIGGMQAHFTYKPANAQNLYYATFPYYGARLKHIREHMDRIQPKGFRGLLKDNRNSMPFYTFWFAVIFGGTSVFLALLSLVVSSVQTWAAYHPPNSSGNKGS
ncbi:hypothetical protein DL98DRAFT_223687 [Cadophora sp. DSE1049]|nr:hypothetical protein DL98DRAFT_223687 [Cadophora sp. DSE1049]